MTQPERKRDNAEKHDPAGEIRAFRAAEAVVKRFKIDGKPEEESNNAWLGR